MDENLLKKLEYKKKIYKYDYTNNFAFNEDEDLENLKNIKSMYVISAEKGVGEVVIYEINQMKYNCKDHIIYDTTERVGNISQHYIYDNIYDDKYNLIKVSRTNLIDDKGEKVRVFSYENIYDKEGKINRVLDRDGEELFRTIDFKYNNKKIIEKHIEYENEYRGSYGKDYSKTYKYYYDKLDMLCKKEEYINGELSCYYKYTILEDGRSKKNLVNPAKGKYKWKVEILKKDKSCSLYMYEPLLTPEIIKEVMNYIIQNYKSIIDCVIIDIYYTNSGMYGEENFQLYNYYRDNYNITILENL